MRTFQFTALDISIILLWVLLIGGYGIKHSPAIKKEKAHIYLDGFEAGRRVIVLKGEK